MGYIERQLKTASRALETRSAPAEVRAVVNEIAPMLVADLASARAEIERLHELAERRRVDRAEALSVTTKEGLSASEWVARTGKAEADNARLRALLGEAREVLPDPTAIRYSLIKRIDAELAGKD